MSTTLSQLDLRIIAWARRVFVPLARVSFFIIFFYFGFLKLTGMSPATPLAEALTAQTVGLQYFTMLYSGLAVLECIIGLLFLVPKATRIVIPLLFVHLAVVCSPLLLLPGQVFSGWFVPTLEGQYIIKNVVLVAAAIGIAAQVTPLKHTTKNLRS